MGGWWEDLVGYQVYVPSFLDSNGDGWGDLPGVTSRLGYLADLGVGLVWLSPFHPSPFADHGYDVADYRSLNPRLGDLADLAALLEEAGRLGLRVLMDLVPNHTSSAHAWFTDALTGPGAAHRDWYIWRPPGPGGGPPNNWVSRFGGPAWAFDQASGEYYLHLFAPEQPDLNWRNPAVAAEFDDIMAHWLDFGFSGFRLDVPHVVLKHPDLPDNPEVPAERVRPDVRGATEWGRFEHLYDMDQPDLFDLYRRWQAITAPRGAMLLGEVNITEPARLARYTDGGGLDAVFWFGLIEQLWEPERLPPALVGPAGTVPGLAWVLSSHDRPRAPTRYGGAPAGRRRSLALAALTVGLPGFPFLYQGDELGLEDIDVPADQVQDPLVLWGGATYARDRARSPHPWAPGPGLGFTTAPQAWMPLGQREPSETVEAQVADRGSLLHAYRELFSLRGAEEDLRRGELAWVSSSAPLLSYRRGSTAVAANLGPGPGEVPLPPGRWQAVYRTDRSATGTGHEGRVPVAPEHVVVLKTLP